jgi:hypothetical protein
VRCGGEAEGAKNGRRAVRRGEMKRVTEIWGRTTDGRADAWRGGGGRTDHCKTTYQIYLVSSFFLGVEMHVRTSYGNVPCTRHLRRDRTGWVCTLGTGGSFGGDSATSSLMQPT